MVQYNFFLIPCTYSFMQKALSRAKNSSCSSPMQRALSLAPLSSRQPSLLHLSLVEVSLAQMALLLSQRAGSGSLAFANSSIAFAKGSHDNHPQQKKARWAAARRGSVPPSGRAPPVIP